MSLSNNEFSHKSNRFMTWLKDQRGVRVNPKLVLADLRQINAGRGVVASENIDDDEELFAIPENLVLSVQNSDLKTHINFVDEELDSWSSLIVTMIYEYLQGGTSRWSTYFTVLPTDFDTLMFWTESELHELQASSIVDKIGKQEADEMIFEKIWPLVLKYPHIFPPSTGVSHDKSSILELAHRMGTLVMAYAFDIEPSDEENHGEDGYLTDDEELGAKGMVPLADLLNADAHKNNARLFQEDGYLIMRSIMPIAAGEEIYNDYGELPRADLLRRYGYITENYARYDVVEISLQSICKAANVDINCPKLQFLDDVDALEDGYALPLPEFDADPADILPNELLILLRTLQAPIEQLDKMKRRGNLPKAHLDTDGAKLLTEILQTRLMEYSTSIMQDEEILCSLNTPQSSSDHRREMAIRVRKGEKEILLFIRDILHAYIVENDQTKVSTKRPFTGPIDENKRAKIT